MTGENLFGAVSPGTFNDGDPIATGTRMVFNAPGFVDGIRFYAPSTIDVAHTFVGALWLVVNDTTGTKLAEATFAPIASGDGAQFHEVAFASPVAVAAVNADTPKCYAATVWSSSGYYVATGGVFNGQPVSNGAHITGIETGSIPAGYGGSLHNGVFDYSTSPAFPRGSFGGGAYFTDVMYREGEAPPEEHSGTAALALSVAPAPSGRKRGAGNAYLSAGFTLIPFGAKYARGVALVGVALRLAAAQHRLRPGRGTAGGRTTIRNVASGAAATSLVPAGGPAE